MQKFGKIIRRDEHLESIVGNIERGKYKIPRFQRRFTWKDKQIEEFVNSLIKGFPIPSFLFLDVGNTSSDTYNISKVSETLGGYEQELMDNQIILDGQQRLTSIYHVFSKYSNEKYVIDLFELEEYFICLKTNSDYSHLKFCKKYNPKMNNKLNYLKTSLILDDEEQIDLEVDKYLSSTSRDSKFKETFKIWLSRLFTNLSGSEINIIQLNKKSTFDFIIQVFEKVNNSGTPLTTMDLINAKSSIKTEEGHFISISDRYLKFLEKLKRTNISTLPFIKSNSVDFNKILNLGRNKDSQSLMFIVLKILQMASAINRYNGSRTSFNQNKAELLKLSGKEWFTIFDRYEDDLISIFYLFSKNDLSIKSQAFMEHICSILLSKPKLITNYRFISEVMRYSFYLGALSKIYSRSEIGITVKFYEYGEDLLSKNSTPKIWFDDEHSQVLNSLNNLISLQYTNRPGKFKSIYEFLSFSRFEDTDNFDIIGNKLEKSNIYDIHHIIPKKSKDGKVYSSEELNSIVNLAPLLKESNIEISNSDFESYRDKLHLKDGHKIEVGFKANYISEPFISAENLLAHREQNIRYHIMKFISGDINIFLDLSLPNKF